MHVLFNLGRARNLPGGRVWARGREKSGEVSVVEVAAVEKLTCSSIFFQIACTQCHKTLHQPHTRMYLT